ncbi:ComEA family DNA-binding protein [Knoellia sp. S7-12]|uniref:ComEA family DNA-binding protein n=1 Tax=Knoellia sp. S7-12 TaxID=3126698 RepID=UPI0033673BCD
MPFRREPDTVSARALARVRGGGNGLEGGGVGGSGDRAGGGGGDGAGGSGAGVGERAGQEDRGRHRPLEVPRGPVFELPTSLRGARWVPSRSAAMALLAVVVVVAVVFGVRVWLAGAGEGAAVGHRAAAGAEPTGVSRGTSTLSRASPSASASGGSGPGASSGGGASVGGAGAGQGTGAAGVAGPVVVHVVGQVVKPGVYRMAAGARVGDAVSAAGGASRAADLTAVNLARVLVDGEQIVVPKPGDVLAGPGAPGTGSGTGAGAVGGSGGAGGGGAGSGSTGGTVSLNSADLSALDTLPGVGPVLAQRILDWRTEHGRFTSVEELGEVSGIGEKLLAQLTPKVTL